MFDAVTTAEDNMQSKLPGTHNTKTRGFNAEKRPQTCNLMTDAGRNAEVNMQSRLSGTHNTRTNEAA